MKNILIKEKKESQHIMLCLSWLVMRSYLALIKQCVVLNDVQ